MIRYKKQRMSLILLLLLLVPVGFYSKFYSGAGSFFINSKLGGLFYVMFWALLVKILIYKWSSLRIALGVLAVTCILEVTQLMDGPFLQWVRGSFIGRTLIGQSFSFSDMVWYVIGAAVTFIILHFIEKDDTSAETDPD